MKGIILAAAFTLAAISTYAQAGSWYIGGAVSYYKLVEKTESTNGSEQPGHVHVRWSFMPEVGTFLTKSLQLGAGFTMAGVSHDSRTAITSTYTSLSIGGSAYLRKYFGNGSFRPFVGINVSVLPGTQENTEGTVVTTNTELLTGANLNAGFAYNLSDKVAVIGSVATLGFTQRAVKDGGTGNKYTRTEFGMDATTTGNRFNVGVYYTFRR